MKTEEVLGVDFTEHIVQRHHILVHVAQRSHCQNSQQLVVNDHCILLKATAKTVNSMWDSLCVRVFALFCLVCCNLKAVVPTDFCMYPIGC